MRPVQNVRFGTQMKFVETEVAVIIEAVLKSSSHSSHLVQT